MNSDKQQNSKSLRYSTINGIFASAMTGFANEYLTPFLLLLGGTVRQVGILNAFPNIAASLIQLKSADLTERLQSRKKIVTLFAFVQGIILLILTTIAILKGITPFLFIVLMVLFASCSALINPAWGSWLSELVDKSKRGEFFGWRNKTLGLIITASAFIAGLILHLMKRINVFYGFAILFGFAFLFRMVGLRFLREIDEPQLTNKKGHQFSFLQFLSRFRESNFAKFVLFVSAMSFSVNLASPYFAVLMLKDLRFSYLLYTIMVVSSTLTLNLAMTRWGRYADKIGNIRIIQFTSPLIGIIPLLWVINRHPTFLVFAQVFSGLIWAGFNLCTSNFIYDAVTPEKRTRCIAYFNVLNGLALSFGALLGGFILRSLPPLFGYRILTLFLISSIFRIFVGTYFPWRLKEVRPVEKINSSQLFFGMINTRAILGVERKTIRY
ncbi:MAG: MFS transporter [Candidatus Omnitrophica bacterium]|nr:MFS transporter [Candidatus Omnitrophota bacterium]